MEKHNQNKIYTYVCVFYRKIQYKSLFLGVSYLAVLIWAPNVPSSHSWVLAGSRESRSTDP